MRVVSEGRDQDVGYQSWRGFVEDRMNRMKEVGLAWSRSEFGRALEASLSSERSGFRFTFLEDHRTANEAFRRQTDIQLVTNGAFQFGGPTTRLPPMHCSIVRKAMF